VYAMLPDILTAKFWNLDWHSGHSQQNNGANARSDGNDGKPR
jgi:hypothetical protein